MKREKLIELIKNTNLDEMNDIQLRKIAIDMDVFCECCENKMYLEVTREDSKEYIEACDNCFYIVEDRDSQARILAENDGYRLDANGKIKESACSS